MSESTESDSTSPKKDITDSGLEQSEGKDTWAGSDPPVVGDSSVRTAGLEATTVDAANSHSREFQGEGTWPENVPDVQLESEFQRLAPQQVVLEQRVGYITALIVGGIIIGASTPVLLFGWARPWIAWLVVAGWLLLIGLLVFSSHFWPRIAYRHASWRLSPVGLEIRRGVLWRHRISVPVARVQHVDVSQGPMQRMLDLGKLTIHTAGTQNASVELEGLRHAQAMHLRDQLIEQKESLDVT